MPNTRESKNQRGKPCAAAEDPTIEEEDAELTLADIMSELKYQRSEIMGRLDGIDARLEKVTSQVSSIKAGLAKTDKAVGKHERQLDESRTEDLHA